MRTYPVNLVGLEHRLCLVVGGGPVAMRKIEGLLAAGARVMVVAPLIEPALQALFEADAIELRTRPFEPEDLDAAFLVVAATDDSDLNHAVSAAALARGALVNVVDDPASSNFIVPAVVRRGNLTIAISTGGASPALARRLREETEQRFGPEYEDLVDLLAELRSEVIAGFDPGRARLEAALRLIDADLVAHLRQHGKDATLKHARSLLGLD